MNSFNLLLPIFCCLFSDTSLVKVKLALMFSRENSREEKVFNLALEDYKSGYQFPPPDKVEIDILHLIISKDDMFKLSHQMCKVANESVATILSGSAEIPIPAIIQSYASAFEIPHLTFQTGISELNAAFELQPRFERAIYELIAHLKWKVMAIVFDNFNAMQRLQNFMGGTQVVNTKYVFDDMSIETALREMKTSQQTNVLLFLSKNYTELFFEKAAEKEMLTQKYHYVIADLRMPCRKVQFNISGRINITCFKLLEDSDAENQKFMQRWKSKYPNEMDVFEEFQLEMALAYDSFKVLATVLDHPDLNRVSSNRVGSQAGLRKPCLNYSNVVASHQTNIANLLSKLKMSGVTGNIEFTNVGLRKNYQLQILDVGFQNVNSRIANWSDQTGLVFERGSKNISLAAIGAKPQLMRVTTVLSEPFVMLKEEFEDWADDPKKRAHLREEHMNGFLIDLIQQIMKPYGNIKYEIKLVKDGAYGAEDENGTWNGMIGELLRGEADVALAPLTINSGRQNVVDFTKPYMTLGISIMMREPSEKSLGLFSFLGPLTNEIWMCCLLAYVSVSVVLFLVSRFSSNDQTCPTDGEEDNSDEQSMFGIINCLWFSLGSFMQQGGDICPNSLPGRIVASSWWFFTLIIISSYTANLAAFLTADRMKTPIKGAEDLAAQTTIEYGVLGSGSSKQFFAKSTVGTYQRMHAFMKDRNLFTKTTEEGVARVRDETDNFAFLMESIMMEYYNQQPPCNTYEVGGKLNTITYGLATPKDSPFLGNLTIQILELIEENVIEKLKNKWWYEKSPCPAKEPMSSGGASRLTIDRVLGVFVLLGVAIGAGVIIAIADTFVVSFKQSFKWKVPVKKCASANMRMALTGKYEAPLRNDFEEEKINQFNSLGQNFVQNIAHADSSHNVFSAYGSNNNFAQFITPDGSINGTHLRQLGSAKPEFSSGYPLLEFQSQNSAKVHTNV